MSRCSVRLLTEEDWEVLRAVRLAMLLDAPGAYGSTYAREVAFTEETWRQRTGQAVFLAEREDGLPLGTATLLRLDPGDDPEIVAMWVAGHARGTGVADALVDACRDRAVAEGAERVRMHVMLDNPRAVACYTRLGFAFDGGASGADGCACMHWRPSGDSATMKAKNA
ncbi:GNAT family N-acetyltransferase [Janibacter cremeus]|uniref:GNAT family N-acetyltransferase n=1 Tax=Janibacter cremeus TaxID=1285192 RepID=UPI0023FA1291|nr:GNAT family N-acetyltransferase [Janibacter cremeus]WEV76700.1 GNAT family N-acetyltransferase [Janibacter cremeus]